MSWALFGLFCLCFMSLGSTHPSVGVTTTSGDKESSAESNFDYGEVAYYLFDLMDMQITRDKNVTIPEYEDTFKEYDINKDNYFSVEEARYLFEYNMISAVPEAEILFGNVSFIDRLELGLRFTSYDMNNDEVLSLIEFNTRYKSHVDWIRENSKKPIDWSHV